MGLNRDVKKLVLCCASINVKEKQSQNDKNIVIILSSDFSVSGSIANRILSTTFHAGNLSTRFSRRFRWPPVFLSIGRAAATHYVDDGGNHFIGVTPVPMHWMCNTATRALGYFVT